MSTELTALESAKGLLARAAAELERSKVALPAYSAGRCAVLHGELQAVLARLRKLRTGLGNSEMSGPPPAV